MNKNLQTLISHQAWRTGSEDGMLDPADISKALNWAIGELTYRTTTDNTAVIRQLEREVESLQDMLDRERNARRNSQMQRLELSKESDRYGQMISAALQGKRHPKEPDNDGRLNAIRAMVSGLDLVRDKYRTEQSLRAQAERHCDKLAAELADIQRLYQKATVQCMEAQRRATRWEQLARRVQQENFRLMGMEPNQ